MYNIAESKYYPILSQILTHKHTQTRSQTRFIVNCTIRKLLLVRIFIYTMRKIKLLRKISNSSNILFQTFAAEAAKELAS